MSKEISGTNLESIKEMNISAVLNSIFSNSGTSRIDVARETGISCALVTKILSKLISANAVTEKKISVPERGRPKVALSFNYDEFAIVGLRINIKYISSILCTASGEILGHNIAHVSDDMTASDIYDKCCELINAAIYARRNRTLLGIGIAAPGPLPKDHNRVTALNNNSFEGFSEIEIVKSIEDKFNLPVVMWHDAHCGAFNEYVFGEDDNKYDNIVFVATDSGLGAGVIIDGKPYTGGGGLAGEIGQMIIDKNGTFVKAGQLVSQTALVQRCKSKSIDDVIELVKSDNNEACCAFDEYLNNLAVVLANFVTTISPEAIIISDKIAQLSERVYKVCDKLMQENLPDEYYKSTKLIIRSYGKHSVLRGACGALLYEALMKPCKYFNL